MAARQRRGKNGPSSKEASITTVPVADLPKTKVKTDESNTSSMDSLMKGQPVWVVLAVASGACAAINGVFAKLTTTSLTTTFATQLSTVFGLEPENSTVNVALRGTFFGLNLLFNGIMWALFTAALTKGNSTTRVSIVNVSANFFITAMLGWAIFDEKLPLGWWMGAGLLAAGNVVIGRREEGEKKVGEGGGEQSTGLMGNGDHEQEDLMELDEPPPGGRTRSHMDEENRLKRGEEADAPV